MAPVLSGAGLAVATGDRICLVGRNDSGKSTLLRIAAGLVQADAGERFAQPGTTIQYLSQAPDLAGFTTTLDYVEAGFDGAPHQVWASVGRWLTQQRHGPRDDDRLRQARGGALSWRGRARPRLFRD